MAKPPKVLKPDQSLSAYFGFELRKHRDDAGLSQPELADRLHWAKSAVGNLETAFRSPTQDHARDLDGFFSTDRFGWLYGLMIREQLPDFFRPFDEGVIRRQVGGSEVMRKQLDHLLNMAERYNVTIQIVPGSIGAYPGLEGGFSILSFDEGADVAFAEAAGGGHIIEQQKDVAATVTRFELIRAQAICVEESIGLIREAL
jgi:transcriptional regulator with XRE-family HTH domain